MLPGRPYLMKIGTRTVGVTIANPKYRVDVNTLEHLAANTLELNEIGVCNLSLDRPIPFDAVQRQPRHGRLHHHRQDHAEHRRCRAAALRAAALPQHPLAGRPGRQGRPGRAQQPSPRRRLAHRPVGLRQVDDRQHRRVQAAHPRCPHLPARRRQRSSRSQPRPRLHRRRSRREHPPDRRGVRPDGRRRPGRARLVHLAVPGRAPAGARSCRGRRVHRGPRRRIASTLAESRDPKGLYAKAAPGRAHATSPGSTRRTKRPSHPRSASTPHARRRGSCRPRDRCAALRGIVG